MTLNNAPCTTCRTFQSDPDSNPLIANIREKDTVLRGKDRFFVCPECEKLFAVKAVQEEGRTRYALVSSASVNKRYQWMVDGPDGRRQRAKGTMTEEEARRKYSNPEKIVHKPIYQPTQ